MFTEVPLVLKQGELFTGSCKGVAVDAQGNIYVADSRNERIVKLSPAGKVLIIWDRSPNVVSSLAVDTQGNLYVTEDPLFSGQAPEQLEKFSATGKTISVWKGLSRQLRAKNCFEFV